MAIIYLSPSDLSLQPNTQLSLYAEYLIHNPLVACSRRQLNRMVDAHRLMAHVNVWKTISNQNDTNEPFIISEVDYLPETETAFTWVQNLHKDVVILSYTSSFAIPNPMHIHDLKRSFHAEKGTLSYALSQRAARLLYNYAIPIEEPIDALFVTLSEIQVLQFAVAPEAAVYYAPLFTVSFWKYVSESNTKKYIPDWSSFTMLVVLFGSLLLSILCRHLNSSR